MVEHSVRDVAERFPSLHLTRGKMACELRLPGLWNKGRAITWLPERLARDPQNGCPICLGDDLTDEYVFGATEGWG